MRSTELLLVEKRYNTNIFFPPKKCDFPHNISVLGHEVYVVNLDSFMFLQMVTQDNITIYWIYMPCESPFV